MALILRTGGSQSPDRWLREPRNNHFKNVKIPQSRIINRIATSTLGVLLIHANSDAMRNWLWKDVLKNVTYYNSPFLVLHALGAVGGIYLICTVIDQLRIRLIEVPLFKRLEKR